MSATGCPCGFHHDPLKALRLISCGPCRLGYRFLRGAIRDGDFRERFGNKKPIPTAQPPSARHVRRNGKYRSLRPMRGYQRTRSVFEHRALRTVRCNRDFVPVLELAHEREERALAASRRRAANQTISKRRRQSRHELTVTVLAYQHGYALIAMMPKKRKQLPVP